MYGGRISLLVALVATVIAMAIAITLGLLAAYKGGLVDDVINLVDERLPRHPEAAAPDRRSRRSSTRPGRWSWRSSSGSRAGRSRRAILRGQALTLCRPRLHPRGAGCRRVDVPDRLPRAPAEHAQPHRRRLRVRLHPGGVLRGGARVPRLRRREQGQLGDDAVLGDDNSTLLQGEWWHFVFPGLAISLTILSIVFINFGIDELGDPRLRQKEPSGRGSSRACSGRRARLERRLGRDAQEQAPPGRAPLLELTCLVVEYGTDAAPSRR